MNLTPQEEELGRRNFLKVLAGTPALAALGAATLTYGPVRGGPVKAALVGPGREGKLLLNQAPKEYISIRALCDINPKHTRDTAQALEQSGLPRPREYQDWKEMLAKEDLEAVLIATPLSTHAEITVGCLDAGKHVLCEKMMAWDMAGCERMLAAARRNRRLLEIGHQRFYNPIYQAAKQNVIDAGVLGDVYACRLVWHRNTDWRWEEKPPAADFDPRPWGYPNWEHLANWRLYRAYSAGLMGELASHQVAVTNWFLGATPEAVMASGGIHRFKDGREVADHIFVTYDYPGGRNVTFSSIQSNKFDGKYELIMGTKGTLVLAGESDAFLFTEDETRATGIGVSPRGSEALLEASASRTEDVARRSAADGSEHAQDPLMAYRLEIAGFCASIRTGQPLRCGAERAAASARACLVGNESAEKKARLSFA